MGKKSSLNEQLTIVNHLFPKQLNRCSWSKDQFVAINRSSTILPTTTSTTLFLCCQRQLENFKLRFSKNIVRPKIWLSPNRGTASLIISPGEGYMKVRSLYPIVALQNICYTQSGKQHKKLNKPWLKWGIKHCWKVACRANTVHKQLMCVAMAQQVCALLTPAKRSLDAHYTP